MKLLLSFSDYCELYSVLKTVKPINSPENTNSNLNNSHLSDNLSLLQVKAMFVADPYNTKAIENIIANQCNPDMIGELMNYFDKNAPIQKILKKRLRELEKMNTLDIETVVNSKDNNSQSVYDILIEQMNKKNIEADPDLYNYINMDRRIFNKLKVKNATISRENALWFAVGFELNYPEAIEFLGKLGYSFRNSDERDLLISQVMRTRKYTFEEMQSILDSFKLKTFGEVKEDDKDKTKKIKQKR